MYFFRTFKKSTALYKVHNMGLRYIIYIFPCGQTRATLDQEVEARQSNLIPLPRKLDDEKNRQQGFYQCSGFIVTYIFRLLFLQSASFWAILLFAHEENTIYTTKKPCPISANSGAK